jgi:hypothetical protein
MSTIRVYLLWNLIYDDIFCLWNLYRLMYLIIIFCTNNLSKKKNFFSGNDPFYWFLNYILVRIPLFSKYIHLFYMNLNKYLSMTNISLLKQTISQKHEWIKLYYKNCLCGLWFRTKFLLCVTFLSCFGYNIYLEYH